MRLCSGLAKSLNLRAILGKPFMIFILRPTAQTDNEAAVVSVDVPALHVNPLAQAATQDAPAERM